MKKRNEKGFFIKADLFSTDCKLEKATINKIESKKGEMCAASEYKKKHYKITYNKPTEHSLTLDGFPFLKDTIRPIPDIF